MALSEENEGSLGDVMRAAVSLLRASDTFKWLTDDAAHQLAQRSARRQAAIERLHALSIPHISAPSDQHELKEILSIARTEAAVQAGLAEFLRRLGKEEGDA